MFARDRRQDAANNAGMGYERVPQRHNKQIAFLAALAKGKTPVEAARLVGLPWPTFYTWRRKHTRFRKAWDQARAYGATPEFPPPAVLARMEIMPHDEPVQIEYRSMLARDLCAYHNWPLKPLPDNYVVVKIPECEMPKIEARLAAIEDPAERELERRRWLSVPPIPDPPHYRRRENAPSMVIPPAAAPAGRKETL